MRQQRININFRFDPYTPELLDRIEKMSRGERRSDDPKKLATDLRCLAQFTLEVVRDVDELIRVLSELAKAGALEATKDGPR